MIRISRLAPSSSGPPRVPINKVPSYPNTLSRGTWEVLQIATLIRHFRLYLVINLICTFRRRICFRMRPNKGNTNSHGNLLNFRVTLNPPVDYLDLFFKFHNINIFIQMYPGMPPLGEFPNMPNGFADYANMPGWPAGYPNIPGGMVSKLYKW